MDVAHLRKYRCQRKLPSWTNTRSACHAHCHPVAAAVAVQHRAPWSRRPRSAATRCASWTRCSSTSASAAASPELFYQGEPVGPVDAVIPRIGASITFYGLAVVRQFEMMGVYCLNESQAIARSRDKLRCLQLLSRHDIGLPPTVYTRQADHVAGCIERVDGPPVVVKLLQGTQGIGVVLAETRARRPARSSRRSTGWTRTS